MNIETKMLNSLKVEQQRFALEALTHPQDKTEWQFGYLVGMTHGYNKSIELLLNLLNEEKNDRV